MQRLISHFIRMKIKVVISDLGSNITLNSEITVLPLKIRQKTEIILTLLFDMNITFEVLSNLLKQK